MNILVMGADAVGGVGGMTCISRASFADAVDTPEAARLMLQVSRFVAGDGRVYFVPGEQVAGDTVSSAAMRSTSDRTSGARSVTFSRLPMGVATT